MPLSSDPNEFAPVVLDTDQDKPEAMRPTFHARFLTVTQTRKVAKLVAQAFDEQNDDASLAILDEALAIQYSAWSHVTNPDGSPATFRVVDGKLQCDDVLHAIDKWELARAATAATRETHLEKKRSRSRWRSGAASSAPNAATNAVATSQPAEAIASTSPA